MTARFTTGVGVLTTAPHDGAPHGLTVNSFNSLSLEPPLVMAAIALDSLQLPAFEESDFFALNILAEQQHLSVHFARRRQGRFDGVAWRPGFTGAPLFDQTLAAIECRAVQRFDAGDHRVLARLKAAEARDRSRTGPTGRTGPRPVKPRP